MTTTDLATLKAQLAEAEAKLHEIETKGQVTQRAFSLGGQHAVSTTPLDPARLENYIGKLKIKIARLEGRGSGRTRQVVW